MKTKKISRRAVTLAAFLLVSASSLHMACAEASVPFDYFADDLSVSAAAVVEEDKYLPPEWLELFKKEYKRIKPSTGNQYNQQRSQGTPTWNTIAKLIGESEHKWSNMKKVAGVEDVPISSKKPST